MMQNGTSPSNAKRSHEVASSSATSPRKAARASLDHTHANGSRSSSKELHSRHASKNGDAYGPDSSPRLPSSSFDDEYQLDPTQAPSTFPHVSSSGRKGASAPGGSDELEDMAPQASSSSSGTARPSHARTSEEQEEVQGLLEKDEGEGEYLGDEEGASGAEGEGENGTEAEGDSEDDDEDEEDEEDEEDDASSVSVDIEREGREGSEDVVFLSSGDGVPHSPRIIKKEPSLLPDDIAAAAGEGTEVAEGQVNTLVAKKKRPPRRRSPSEDAPAPVLPVLTVRLEMALPEPDHLTYPNWNVLDMAREAGMVSGWNTDVVEAGPSGTNGYEGGEDEEMDGAEEGGEARGETALNGLGASNGEGADPYDHLIAKYAYLDEPSNKPKAKSKAKKPQDAYDIDDDFIDDSAIEQDAPTHYARTVKEGFFVEEGAVEVEIVDTPKAKPRNNTARRPAKPAVEVKVRKSLARITGERQRRQERAKANGIKDEEEDSVYIEPEEEVDEIVEVGDFDVDRTVFVSASRNTELLPPWPAYPSLVRTSLLQLLEKSKAHPWNLRAKGKFPSELHESLRKASVAAWQYDLFDVAADDKTDNWFAALPSCLPYNTFTLKKLSVKKNLHEYWEFLQNCEETGLYELRKLVEAGKAEFEEKKLLEESKHANKANQGPDGQASAPEQANGGSSDLLAPESTIKGTEGDTSDIEVEAVVKPPNEQNAAEPPKKVIPRFTLSGEISDVMVQLYENAAVMRSLYPKAEQFRVPDASDFQIKESTQTTKLNQKIMQCFPADSVSSTMLSRQKTKVAARRQNEKNNESK